jgi:VanZ family protein
MSQRRFAHPRLWRLLAWLIVTVIVVLSLMPPLQLQSWDMPSWNDKVGHFFAYFVLSAWYAQLYGSARAMRHRIIFCLALGAALEGLQSLTETRSADWRDMVANSVGVMCGGLTWFTGLAGTLQRWDR